MGAPLRGPRARVCDGIPYARASLEIKDGDKITASTYGRASEPLKTYTLYVYRAVTGPATAAP